MAIVENKSIEEKKKYLLETLSPKQLECFDGIDWFYNGARASGRTYLSCVVALIGLMNGNLQSYVLDHSPYMGGIKSYHKSMICRLADKIGLAIEVKEIPNGFVVRLAPDYIQYEYDQKKHK